MALHHCAVREEEASALIPGRGSAIRHSLSILAAGALIASACTGNAPGGQIPDEPRLREADGSEVASSKATFRSACALPIEHLRRIRRGYRPGRSPDVFMVPRAPNFIGSFPLLTSHSGPWNYLQRVPLVFYGPGFVRQQGEIRLEREATVADIAPTLADVLGVELPGQPAGRSIEEALLPADERNGDPRLILTLVLDGGGWNVLDAWPQSWPNLERLMEGGTSVKPAIVGSSPSVTPAVHATIGTGSFPNRHGMPDIPIRFGDEVRRAFFGKDPRALELPTIADVYDRATGNEALVGHLSQRSHQLGMLGHGASIEGGDRDIAAVVSKRTGRLGTNRQWFRMPRYVHDISPERDAAIVDIADGHRDSMWRGHTDLSDLSQMWESPAGASFQTRVFKQLISREGFGRDTTTDLWFMNYKQIDVVGHTWNMLSPEERDTLEHTDKALGEIVEFLDRRIGENNWMMVITADHGQTPDATTTGAWPISNTQLRRSLADHFGVSVDDLFLDTGATGLWLNHEVQEARGIDTDEVAGFVLDYRLKHNLGGDDPPPEYRDRLNERLFAAAFASKDLPAIWRCATSKDAAKSRG